MNREEAIHRLKKENYQAAPGQEFEIDRMQTEDAWGVARCFFAVYGEHYPFDVYYIPEQLVEENRLGNLHSVVARTSGGDVIGYGALFRSSAHSRRVYEFGQGIVLPAYRSTTAMYCIQGYVLEEITAHEDIDEVFGEGVCNHTLTQRLCAIEGFGETGIEVGLMPPDAYSYEEFPNDRISTVLGFKCIRNKPQTVYFPLIYQTELTYILSGLDISRELLPAGSAPPAATESGVASQFFDRAQVARFNIYRAGQDFPLKLTALEDEAGRRRIQVCQFFVNLGQPSAGWITDLLRNRGYFLGAFLPRWFDTDGLLLQKVTPLPNPASIKLHSLRAQKLFNLIRKDISSNKNCFRTPQW
ncbi:MAG TPA: hypothetical protein PKN70_14505 [Smithellaceae bacterium]|nr:hypothetical protein [Smithellaceae bacterium]